MAWRDGGRPTSSVLPSFFPEIENPQRWGGKRGRQSWRGMGREGGRSISQLPPNSPFPPSSPPRSSEASGEKEKGRGKEKGGEERKPHFFRFYECKQNGGSRGKSGGARKEESWLKSRLEKEECCLHDQNFLPHPSQADGRGRGTGVGGKGSFVIRIPASFL